MNFKKVIILLIALMIITPSFAFAAESDSASSGSGKSSSSQSSENMNTEPTDSKPAENTDSSLNSSESEQSDEKNENQQEAEENEEPEMQLMAAAASVETPEIDVPTMTTPQSSDFSYSNDAYLTSLFSGAAVYTYPIQVPKGINDFQPKIELIYNSQSVGGQYDWLGSGWSLNEYYILRDVNFTPNDVSDDKFKLIFGEQTHNLIFDEKSGFYHTEIETYMKIQKVSGGSNQKGEYWIVNTKDGIEYRFGFTEDSELLNSVPERNYVHKWKLDKIEDLNENSIFYSYVKNPREGEIGASYLKNISYNDGFAVIEFERIEKPFVFNAYKNGSQIIEKCLLSNIIIKNSKEVISIYSIEYTVSDIDVSLDCINLTTLNNSDCFRTSFNYEVLTSDSNFSRNPDWTIPVIFSSRDAGTYQSNGNTYDVRVDYDVRIADINGDGLPDQIQSYRSNGNNNQVVWINNGSGFTKDSNWTIPVIFSSRDAGTYQSNGNTYDVRVDYDVRIADMNGDGLPDLIQSNRANGYNNQAVWINNGSGFTKDINWTIPIIFSSRDAGSYPWNGNTYDNRVDYDVRIADINGDGLPDLIQSYKDNNYNNQAVWINNGSGFTKDINWTIPVIFSSRDSGTYQSNGDTYDVRVDYGVRIIDINGDGLPDLIQSYRNNNNNNMAVWINSGSGFVRDSNWTIPVTFYSRSAGTYQSNGNTYDDQIDYAVRIADVNDDGFPDIIQSNRNNGYNTQAIWINTGNGFIHDTNWTIPVIFSSRDAGSYPWNGNTYDVRVDYAVKVADLNGDGLPDLIQSYRENNYNNQAIWINSFSSSHLLRQITHPSGSTTKIEYETSTKFNNTKENGMQGLPIPIKVVKKVEIDNGMKNDYHTISTYTYDYENGLMNIVKGKIEFGGFKKVTVNDGRSITEHYFHQDQAKKGREYKTVIKSTSNKLYAVSENAFVANETKGIFEVLLKNSTQSLYDGQAVPVVSKTSYEYDIYGNPVKTKSEGDIKINGDEKTVLYEYTYNVNDWILNKVKKETLENANSKKIAASEFYYDGNSNLNAVPTRGLITKTVNWNSHGDDIVQDFEYDSYGNLIAQYDGNGHLTTVKYGENPIYPISFTNALNQTTLLEYNLSIGKLTKTTDSNGFVTSMEYDGFGRITKVIKPGDSSSSPTIGYRYYIDGVAPEYIQISVKESGNQYYDTWKYYDGLKREIKTESESENPSENIIQETYYNNFGNVSKIVAPRKSSETYLNTTTAYDSFGRLIKITNPDGTAKSVEYNQLKTTAFDERGNKIQSEKDIYDNIIKVTEFNGNEVYETGYEYNTLNNLIKIIPNQNYDQSKISFLVEKENKVMGGSGNTNLVEKDLSSLGLTTPIDTRYKVENVTFEYDSLGRMIKLDDPDLGVWKYEYNANGKKATETDSRQIKTYYDYDALDRIVLIDYPNDADISFEYDLGTIGTLTKVNSGITTKSYQYDERLRVIKETVFIHNGDLSASENANPAGNVQIYNAGILSGLSLSKLKDAIKTVVAIVVTVVVEIYKAVTGSNNNSGNEGNNSGGNDGSGSDDNGSGGNDGGSDGF